MKRQERTESGRQYYSCTRPPHHHQDNNQNNHNDNEIMGINGNGTTAGKTQKKKAKARTAINPEVLISLGFHLLKQDMTFDHVQHLPVIKPDDWIVGFSERGGEGGGGGGGEPPGPVGRLVDPSQQVESLRRQASKQQRDYQLAAADQKHTELPK